MGHRPLQGQHLGEGVHVGGVLRAHLVGLEAEVVVAVHRLPLAAGVDDVDLRGDLVARAQPSRGGEGDDVVGVVGHERLGVGDGQLLEGVPDPVVGAGLGEVVTRGRSPAALVGDHRVEGGGAAVDDVEVVEGPGEHHDPGTGSQRAGQLGLHAAAARRVGHDGAQGSGVVDEDLLVDTTGVRIVLEPGLVGEDREQVLEAAVLRPQPGGCAGGGGDGGGHDAGEFGVGVIECLTGGGMVGGRPFGVKITKRLPLGPLTIGAFGGRQQDQQNKPNDERLLHNHLQGYKNE